MIPNLQNLIHALREELQHYGEMLARLDQQQVLVTRRAADELLCSTAEVEAQSVTIQNAREHRRERQRELARQLQLNAESPFAEIIPLLPADYHPLVAALVQENNELLVRVQQRLRQNHLLLSRALELMNRLIRTFIPGDSSVYTGTGSIKDAVLPRQSTYGELG